MNEWHWEYSLVNFLPLPATLWLIVHHSEHLHKFKAKPKHKPILGMRDRKKAEAAQPRKKLMAIAVLAANFLDRGGRSQNQCPGEDLELAIAPVNRSKVSACVFLEEVIGQ